MDDVVFFRPLALDGIKKIVDLLTEQLRRRLSDRQITLELTDPAREFIAREGYDPVYGVRPLKRFLQRELETRIGGALVAGSITDGSKLTIALDHGALTIKQESPKNKS